METTTKTGGGRAYPPDKKLSMNRNEIADRLQNISESSTLDKAFARKIIEAVTANSRSLLEQSHWSTVLSMKELNIALTKMKLRKAPGLDQVFPEFLKNLGNTAKKWQLIFLIQLDTPHR
ncbi:hypothetical protein JTB14_029368 [Gonioctena quinquepunctata]|nr:hypothetical protein JTB14_029368 [Gonioctena quinquepunctata]